MDAGGTGRGDYPNPCLERAVMPPSTSARPYPGAVRRQWRSRWVALHRWLGLGLGLILVVVGLTGSLFVFYRELREVLEPERMRVEAPPGGLEQMRTWGEILAAADAAARPEAIVRSVEAPRHSGAAVQVGYVVATEDGEEDSFVLCVNPYTLAVLGESRLDDHPLWKAASFLFTLHYSLHWEEFGVTLVGIVAVGGLLSVTSGLWLWWPGGSRLKSALTLLPKSGAVRRNLDLHRVAGFYGAAALGILLVSGIWMNLHEPFVAVVKWFSPGTRGGAVDEPTSGPAAGRPHLTLAAAVNSVLRAYPGERLHWARTPETNGAVFTVSQLGAPGSTWSGWSERIVRVDAFSGALLTVQDPHSRRTAGDTFLAWQWPLHSGQAFGWPGRLLVFASGFLPLVLALTGLRMWRLKRRVEIRRNQAASASRRGGT